MRLLLGRLDQRSVVGIELQNGVIGHPGTW